MPPASLSTFAVMNPGPTTAKNSRIRVFQRLRNLMGTVHKHGSSTTRQNKCRGEFWIGEIGISRDFKDRNDCLSIRVGRFRCHRIRAIREKVKTSEFLAQEDDHING